MSLVKSTLAAALAFALAAPSAAGALPVADPSTPAAAALSEGVAPEAAKKVVVKAKVKVRGHHGKIVIGPRHKVLVVKPHKVVIKRWRHRPHYGLWLGGVTLGTIVTVGVVGVVPVAPDPSLCWYWTDKFRRQGYWDYCQ